MESIFGFHNIRNFARCLQFERGRFKLRPHISPFEHAKFPSLLGRSGIFGIENGKCCKFITFCNSIFKSLQLIDYDLFFFQAYQRLFDDNPDLKFSIDQWNTIFINLLVKGLDFGWSYGNIFGDLCLFLLGEHLLADYFFQFIFDFEK